MIKKLVDLLMVLFLVFGLGLTAYLWLVAMTADYDYPKVINGCVQFEDYTRCVW